MISGGYGIHEYEEKYYYHSTDSHYDDGDIDIAIAVEHLCLAATEQGLATCWVCNFDAEKCKQLFAIAENEEPAVLIPIGYAADELKKRNARRLRISTSNMAKREYIKANKDWLEVKAKEEGVKALPKGIYYKVLSEGNLDSKKEPAELLDLMKAGAWLIAKEALSWGFVDELTDYEDESAPVLTDAMANEGIPISDMTVF